MIEVFLNLTDVFLNLTQVFLTLTEVFPCFFLRCKANARIKLSKTGHGPHSCKLVVICVFLLISVLFYVLFLCKYLLYYCHRVTTQLQLTNISYIRTVTSAIFLMFFYVIILKVFFLFWRSVSLSNFLNYFLLISIDKWNMAVKIRRQYFMSYLHLSPTTFFL